MPVLSQVLKTMWRAQSRGVPMLTNNLITLEQLSNSAILTFLPHMCRGIFSPSAKRAEQQVGVI